MLSFLVMSCDMALGQSQHEEKRNGTRKPPLRWALGIGRWAVGGDEWISINHTYCSTYYSHSHDDPLIKAKRADSKAKQSKHCDRRKKMMSSSWSHRLSLLGMMIVGMFLGLWLEGSQLDALRASHTLPRQDVLTDCRMTYVSEIRTLRTTIFSCADGS